MDLRSAVSKINKRGALLVFPINNRREPSSLWHEFWPKTEMRWEWDESGDNRVADLWHLRERLSRSGKVVYSKWYRGRATVLSNDLFAALLKVLDPESSRMRLGFAAREILDLLEEDSPLSTKQIKKAVDLRGRESERVYNAAMKELWSSGLVVAFGEIDEGAFPSLAIGATRVIFEDLYNGAMAMSEGEAWKRIDRSMPVGTAMRKYLTELLRSR